MYNVVQQKRDHRDRTRGGTTCGAARTTLPNHPTTMTPPPPPLPLTNLYSRRARIISTHYTDCKISRSGGAVNTKHHTHHIRRLWQVSSHAHACEYRFKLGFIIHTYQEQTGTPAII